MVKKVIRCNLRCNKFNKCFQVWISMPKSLGEGYGMVYDIGGAK